MKLAGVVLAIALLGATTAPAAPPTCARILVGPPGAEWFVRSDTLVVSLAPPAFVGWICRPGSTPPDSAARRIGPPDSTYPAARVRRADG